MITFKEEKDFVLTILDKTLNYTGELNESCMRLKNRIQSAKVCDQNEMPSNQITLGKVFSIKTSFGVRNGIRLVKPEEANMELNKLSVLSNLGSQLYGYKEGDRLKMKEGDLLEYAEIIYVSKAPVHFEKLI